MKKILKIYSIVSVSIILLISVFIAFFTSELSYVFEELKDVFMGRSNLNDLFEQGSLLQNIVAMLLVIYIVNIPFICVSIALAHTTENKYLVKQQIFLIAIYLLIFAFIFYISKLVLETVSRVSKGVIQSLGAENVGANSEK